MRAIVLLMVLASALVGAAMLAQAGENAVVGWLGTGVVLAAGVVVLWRALTRPADRLAWGLMAAACFSWGGAEVVNSVWLAGLADPPVPSIADALWLGYYPLTFAALALLVRRRIGRVPASYWLDAAIGATAVGALAATADSSLIASAPGTTIAGIVEMGYPVGDFLTVLLVVGAIIVGGWRLSRMWVLLLGAQLVGAVSDTVYLQATSAGTWSDNTLMGLGYPVMAILLAAAAWQPQERAAVAQAPGRLRMLATPAVCGLVSIAVVVTDEALGLPASTVVLAALSLGLLIVRLGVAFMENSALLFVKHQESTTDALTALGNRRALLIDLELGAADGAEPGLLMIFDLDGFKRYNDSFGHPAGDALLQRLAVRLAEAAAGLGGLAYRLGGDEFCVLAPTLGRDTEEMTLRACSALRERGDGFEITSSWGAAELPCAGGREQALKVADRRMYALKNGTRPTAAQQSLDVLLATVRERHPDLGDHVDGVAEMAVDTARRLGLDDGEIERIRLAAELHDIGKLGIPDAILHKPGALDATEWEFMRRHTLIGERILHAAPDLHDVAPIVRSTHERWDGAGYPDALAGEAIPLGARVVAVCDAFDAMISHRSYSESISPGAATAELARCAGSQFDPAVVGCFTAMIEQRRELLPAAVPGGSQAALLR